MPSKNIIREDIDESYYHVYARGASKQTIFKDELDFLFFISLFKRYLSPQAQCSKEGITYPHLHKKIKLLAYCLMNNHFHLYVYQKDQGSLSLLMRGIMTSYSKYFNKKYGRTGSLFESRYKSVRITDDSYHLHITRYIHMNPRYWFGYPYSSLAYYKGTKRADWISVADVLDEFTNAKEYINFLKDYQNNKDDFEEIKHQLASN